MAGQKLKIAMMGHKHVLSREGGVEIVVRELATRMAALGHRVTCYDRRTGHVSGSEIDTRREYEGVEIRTVFTVDRRGLAAMTSSLAAAWRAARSDCDVVHIHAEGPAAMCWLPKLAGKKVVVTVHGLDWARAKWGGFASRYIKWGERQAVRHADAIIVLSEDTRKYFDRTYGRKTEFIPNGVCRPEIRQAGAIKRLWGLEQDGYVLFLGRIVPEKGLDCLMEAWKGVSTDRKLVIAGGSSDTTEYMNALKGAAGDNVIFTGFQQGAVLEELYSNAYVYCLPSDVEGMPISLLEAMSYGNCCVVSDIPQCAEVVEDRAVTFPRGDANALRKALQALLDAPETVRRYKDGAADYICAKYSWDDVVASTLRVYREAGKGIE